MKTYYFLAGLPRSGNTLLSSILNQNPSIYSSPISPIHAYLSAIQTINDNSEVANQLSITEPKYNVLRNVINTFYNEQSKPIIIDREKGWGTIPNFFHIQQHIKLEPKIIFTIRPVIEILASFITLANNNPWLDNEMQINRG